MNKNIYTIGQVNAYIKQMFSEDFLLRNISLKGEISNCKYHSSGHIYFTIKDSEGAISAIMFKGNRVQGLRFPMKDGDKVVVTGSVAVYEKGGTYQIYAREISLDGAGDLYLRFEELKKELEEMGMFAPEYKKPIPRFARRIGIVTAPTGAAVRDIIQNSKRRNPYVELFLYPALVQGEGAVESIVAGIRALDQMNLDVMIVGRGGGSIEDLWAFNEEEVARAIFACNTPVISAVGHETDTTISDFVADKRASTPTAAAELASYDYLVIQDLLDGYEMQFARHLEHKVFTYRQILESYQKQLMALSPLRKLNENRQYSISLEHRLEQAMNHSLEQKRARMALLSGRLDGLSPMKKLSQGYSYTADSRGECITSISQVKAGDDLEVYVTDGVLQVEVIDIKDGITWNKN